MKKQSILAGSGILFVASTLSSVLGLVREGSIGYFWGGGNNPHADAFWAAFGVPDLLYYLLSGGALGAAVIPILTTYLHRGEEEESWRIVNTLFTLFWLAAAVGAGAIMIFARPLVAVVAPGFPDWKAAECARYVRIISPMVIFTIASAMSTAILQSHRHFTAPAVAWFVYNIGIIGGAIVGGLWINRKPMDPAGLVGPAVGVIVGAILLVAVQMPSLRARGFRFRPRLELSHPGVKETLRLFPPIMAGLAATQICVLWLPNFLGSYFSGAVASFRYSNRLAIQPYSSFAIAIATAAFPAMAECVAASDLAKLRTLVSGSLRAILLLVIPSAVGLAVLAGPTIRLLFHQGSLNETAVRMATFALVYFAAAFIGLSGLQVINRAFFSLKDATTPLLLALGYGILMFVLALVLMHTPLQYGGIVAGISIGATAGLLASVVLLRRRLGGIDGRAILVSLVRILVASAALAVVMLLAEQVTGKLLHVPGTYFSLSAPRPVPNAAASKLAMLVQVALSGAAGTLAYVGVLALLGAEELGIAVSTVRRRFRAKAPATAS